MNACVLDTSVASLIHKGDSRAGYYEPHLVGMTPAISFQTVAELRLWAELAGWGERRRSELELFIRGFVVIPSSDALATAWVRVSQRSISAGRRLESADAWIAATAAALDAPLLTHDADLNAVSCPGVEIVRYDDAGIRVL